MDTPSGTSTGPAKKSGTRASDAARTKGAAADKGAPAQKHASRSGPSLKLQIDMPGGARLGPGKITLLEMIGAEGSLSSGARKMRISYRRAWLFVQQSNQSFDEVAVATPEHGHGGGPARLTPFGRDLIRRYRELETQTDRKARETLSWLESHTKTPS